MHKLFALTLFILTLTASSVFAGITRINAPNPDDPMDVHIYKLDNGLTVYLTENHEEPRFYAEIAVRAGSKHDPAESTGLAHYLEHMLFKGTQNIGTLDYKKEKIDIDRIIALYEDHFRETDPEKRKAIYAEINKASQRAAQYAIPNELDKLYKAMGESGLNAHTWHEETVYKVGLPSNYLKHWAKIESERFQNPVFRLFQPELEVVYEEKNRTLDNKGWLISEAVNKRLYKKHPYGQQTTIGEVEHLKNPSLKNMYQFYDTYYVPNNMTICISGDIDIDATVQLIDEHFSAWKAKDIPTLKTWEESPIKGAERVTVKFQGEEYVLLAFRTNHRNHKDAEALKLIDMILDNRTAGLINLNLVQQQAVRRAGSYPYLNNDYGAQYLWGIPKKDQTLADVEQLLLDQIAMIKRGEFDESLLSAIVTDFKKNLKRGLESNPSRVRQMTSAFLGFSEWDHEIAEIARMEKVTREDIMRVANHYFGEGYVAGYRIDEQHELPKIDKPKIDKIDIDPTRQSKFAKDVLALSADELSPVFVTDKDYTIAQVRDGVKLYYVKNPVNDLFTFTLGVDMGAYQDNRLSTARSLLDKSGAGDLSPDALKKEWYKLGTDFNIGVSDNETNISISGLDENFEASLSLMMKYIQSPTADQATLDELVKITLAQREDQKKDPRSLRNALRFYSRYGDNSSYKRRISSEALQKLTVAELHGLISSLPTYEHVLIYGGTKTLDEVLAAIKEHITSSDDLKTPPAYERLTVHAPAKTEIRFFHKETAQSQVFVEFGDVAFDTTLRPAIDLYNDYFAGGMSGIVFQELREARALAYSTFARYDLGGRSNDQNVMWGYIGCQADKTPEAVIALAGLIDDLPESPERFAEAKNSVVNRYRVAKIKYRELPGVLRIWERRNQTPDPRKERFDHILQADMPTVLDFHKQHIAKRPKLISIMGDTTKFDLNSLRPLGVVTPVTLDDLFVK